MKLVKKLLYKFGSSANIEIRKNRIDALPEFANKPRNLEIVSPRIIRNSKNIYIGDDVKIGPHSVIKTSTEYPGNWMITNEYPMEKQHFDPVLKIGHRVSASSHLQINAIREIIIEDDVLIAANVFICDALHGYTNVDIPYKYQPMGNISPIIVGRGSWIGQNVVIMPGVTIGEMSIIGANSVVTKSVPPKSIAVGAPARVIKVWDEGINNWNKVN
jgi:acetyltransferase-like isoleucine patch superfamily enzyme